MYVCLNGGTAGGGLPLEEFVKIAADAGFAGADVDLAWGRKHGAAALRELFLKHNLRFGGWGPPVDWRGDEGRMSEGMAELGKQAAIARELGIDSCCTYILPSGDRRFMDNWNFHVNRLRPIAQALADQGLRFGLEFVAPYHLRRKWPHEFIFTAGQMLELADDVGPNAGLLLDSFHVHAAGDAFERIAAIPASRIVLVHLNDAPAGATSSVEDFKRVLPGQGVIDLAGYLGALRTSGYQGAVSLEVFSEELKKLPAAEAAKRAWAATAKALRSAGMK
jgi:sugar phosphate isomerase/epimerase